MRRLLLIFLLLSSSGLIASETIYSFHSDVERVLFEKLTREVRCVVCQGQSIADSNAPLAMDLKRKIHQQLQAGMNEREVKHYLVSRYGDSILLEPPFKGTTVILWGLPFVLLIGAIAFVVRLMCK
jgi:cytochrome c-type biogenesis protein CcmH